MSAKERDDGEEQEMLLRPRPPHRSLARRRTRTDGRTRQRQIELISQWFCCVIADADDDDDAAAAPLFPPLPFRAHAPSTALSSADRR